jgi:hypothetical protein
MAIKSRDMLLTEYDDGKLRGTGTEFTVSQLRDLIDSLGIGGEMYAKNVDPVPVTTNWAPITVMTGVRRTQGITAQLAAGTFTITGNGVDDSAAGIYTVDLSFLVHSTVPGWVEIGMSKDGSAPNDGQFMRRVFAGNDEKLFVIPTGHDFDIGETIGIGIRASGNAPTQMSILDASFRILRG